MTMMRRSLSAQAKTEQRKPAASDPEMVDALLLLHDALTAMVTELFDGNVLFRKALKEAFQDVVNTDASTEIGNVEMLVACVVVPRVVVRRPERGKKHRRRHRGIIGSITRSCCGVCVCVCVCCEEEGAASLA